MGSAYERAVAGMARLDRLIEDISSQVSTPSRDKTGLRWQALPGRGSRAMNFTTEMYAGYYGSSSSCDRGGDAIAGELAKTLDELKGQIIATTVARLEREKIALAQAARKEAESILATADAPEVKP